jgi:hypothetical protein
MECSFKVGQRFKTNLGKQYMIIQISMPFDDVDPAMFEVILAANVNPSLIDRFDRIKFWDGEFQEDIDLGNFTKI